jgi:flagellar motor switch protein FliM
MTAPRPSRSTEQVNQQLSQVDIDRMMLGSTGQPAVPRSAHNADVQVYDFRRPHRVSKERLHVLEAMYSRLVKSFEGWLMGRVRGVIDLRLQSVEQISFGEYVLSLPPSCNSFILDIKDKEGADAVGEQAVIDIGRELAYYLVDRLFGGGSEATILDRALTPIERLAVRVVAERVQSLVQEIWEDHVELELALSGFESIPEIIQAAAREAPVLVTNITASFAGQESLDSIALPLSVLENYFVNNTSSARAHQARREPPGQRVVAEGALRATRVEVAARLPEFRLTMRDIAGLKAGSMLSTGIPVDSTVNLLVGKQPRFKTAAGRVGRKLAVRVLEPLSAEPLTEVMP